MVLAGRGYRTKKDLFDEIVQFVIDGEQEAVDAYTTASEIVTRANVKSMLLDLAGQEQMHKERAHNLYSTLASNTDDAELKKVFEVLAQEEAGHKLALENECDEHVLTDN